jgi:hypothetical protein
MLLLSRGARKFPEGGPAFETAARCEMALAEERN